MIRRRLVHLSLMLCGSVAYSAWGAEPAADAVPTPAPVSRDGPNPPTAVGGYQPTVQVDPTSVRVGPLTVTPVISTAAGHDSNVNLRQTNKVSSAIYTLSPGVTATTRYGGHNYFARYLGNYGHYESSSVDDYDDHAIGAGANSDWSSRLRTQLRYEFFRGHDPRGSTATAIGSPERWETNALRGSVGYGARGAQGNIEVDANLGNKRYETNRVVTAARDYKTGDIAGAFFYRMRPAVYSFVQVRAARFDYETNTSLDSTEMRYYGGVRWDATAKTQGAVKAGYMTKSFSSASRADASTYTYDASITWSPLTYSVFTLNGVRTFSEQTSGGNFILTDNATLLWNHTWSSRVRSSAFLAYGRDVHEGLNRADTRQNVGLKASYAFRRNLRFGGEVREEERRSNVSNVEYKRSVVLITLDASL